METYSLLRQFADSWMLLALFTFFIAMILWVMFRPGASKTYSDVANIPFGMKTSLRPLAKRRPKTWLNNL